MLNRLKQCAWVLCAVVLAGCSTIVQLNVRHAPELDLGGAKSLAVDKFTVSGHTSLDAVNTGNVLRNVLGNALVGGLTAPDDSKVQDAHYRGLVDALVRNDYFQIRESGNVDARMRGNVDYKIEDSMNKADVKEKNGTKTVYTLTRSTTVTVNFQVLSASDVILGTSTVASRNEKKWSGDSEENVRSRARELDLSGYVIGAIAETHAKLLQKISPYYLQEERALEDGKSDLVKQGNKSAEHGDWPGAARYWEAALQDGDLKNRAAALYNLGIYDESQGRLDLALGRFEEARTLTENGKYAADSERIRSRLEENRRLKQMEEKRAAATPAPAASTK